MPTNVVYRRSAPRERFTQYFDLATKILIALLLTLSVAYAALAIEVATQTPIAHDIGSIDQAGGSLERRSYQ
jgi:hypothetical protein